MAGKVISVLEVVVTDKGTTKLVQRNVENLSTSVDRTKKKTQEANKASGDYYNTQALFPDTP